MLSELETMRSRSGSFVLPQKQRARDHILPCAKRCYQTPLSNDKHKNHMIQKLRRNGESYAAGRPLLHAFPVKQLAEDLLSA
eukprot:6943846-Heterocapsa_arctica.AAC.1